MSFKRFSDFPHGAALLSGVLLGLSYPPLPFPFLAGVALLPLLAAWLHTGDGRAALQHAFVAFLATFAVAFSWPLLHARPDTALLSAPGLVVLPLWMALPFGLAVPFRRRLGPAAGLAALSLLWLAAEYLVARGPLAFPWALLGHTQSAGTLAPLAVYAGTAGLTAWLLATNVFLLFASRRNVAAAGVVGLIVLLGPVLAWWAERSIPAPAATARVGVVQPALPPEAWSDVHDAARVDTLLALSRPLVTDASARADVVVWPETALPVAGDGTHHRVQAWVDVHQTPLLTGGIVPAAGPDEPAAFHNAALLFRPGRPTERYDKMRLVPFAERVPFADRLPWLHALAVPAGGVAGYVPGERQSLLEAGGLTIGPLVCFESIFGDFARHYGGGADLLVVLTQDGWWGDTAGYRQHLAINRLRAVETGRALVQVSVTGTTALLRPDGTSAFESAWMERTARVLDVPLYQHTTFYTRHGDRPGMAVVLAALATLTAACFFRRRERRADGDRP